MPFLPLRLAPLVLAATVALSGTATASVLVTVNKATQRMTVSVDGETRYSWPVSTGMKGYATPAGTFRPFRLEEEHYSKEWDDAPMPHSIFFTPAGHAIHGSNATRRLGSPASHGCIRIAPAHAAKLFALVSAEGLSKRIGMPPWKPPAKGNGAGANGHAAACDKVVARYVYQTADGENYLRVSRTASKRFWQERWNGTAWEKGKPQGPKIPYRLPEMQRAVHDTVIIVEGEKDVDTLTELGFVAATASEGAGKWTEDLAHWFEHKTVYIIADKDEPGRHHAQQVAASLYPVAETVRIVEMREGKWPEPSNPRTSATSA